MAFFKITLTLSELTPQRKTEKRKQKQKGKLREIDSHVEDKGRILRQIRKKEFLFSSGCLAMTW